MKVVDKTIPEQSFTSFAEQHDLELEINERSVGLRRDMGGLSRYWVSFKGVEVMENGMLSSRAGNGDTVADAISEYAQWLSTQRIAVDAYTPNRREIDVPHLTTDGTELTGDGKVRSAKCN